MLDIVGDHASLVVICRVFDSLFQTSDNVTHESLEVLGGYFDLCALEFMIT